MRGVIGGFRIEVVGGGWYVRVPWVGAAFIGAGLTAWSSWRSLQEAGEV
jgi:hypothetical protein